MAVSVLAAAASQTSSLGIFTLFNLSSERLPLPPPPPSSLTPLPPPAYPPPSPPNLARPPKPSQTVDSTFLLIPENPQTIQQSSSRPDSNISSLSSSPRQYPTNLTGSSILEEEGDESESEPANEPVTPVSGRQSQDFHTLATHDIHPELTDSAGNSAASFTTAVHPDTTVGSKSPLTLNTSPTTAPPRNPATTISRSPQRTRPSSPPVPSTPITAVQSVDQEPASVPLTRRTSRTGSSSNNFKRTMSNLFRRTNSIAATDKAVFDMARAGDAAAPDVNMQFTDGRNMPTRRWSMNKSSTTTRSNTPPSPSSPIEIAFKTREQASHPTVPEHDQFLEKKSRASTGFNLRDRAINFIAHGPGNSDSKNRSGRGQQPRQARRRASSFDQQKREKTQRTDPRHASPEEHPWGLVPETGTGVKARRMSLSLPDDFHVDVAELQAEFEYQHRLLGRHGKHLGKGATSKVILMARKGVPTEIYAVKEFRPKRPKESKEDYENKIKSEFTLAKALHHPNIVETIRLCTDHGRWNHVMEYCSEGDLFSLVKKGYLTKPDKEKDRICLFKQLVQGINYLHSNGIAHRDIKLENLLMTSDSKLKITDFGVSEVFSGTHPGLRESGGQCGRNMSDVRKCAPGVCGSEPYIAPEVLLKQGEYDPRPLDVWSAAIVMLHLIFGGAIWHRADYNDSKQLNYRALVDGWETCTENKREDPEVGITETDYPRVKAFLHVSPTPLRRLLLHMLHPDPNKRITMADVINNRWVKNIECCQLESYDDPAKTIDASKKTYLNMNRTNGQRKIFCHNHLPPKEHNTHSLGKMPGQTGY